MSPSANVVQKAGKSLVSKKVAALLERICFVDHE